MKHRVAGRRLDRTTEHRVAMFRNLVTSLFRHERIRTTTPKAKEIKRYAERFITLAKQGTPHARRIANRDVRDVEILNKLFDTLGPRFKSRPGGYTRIVRVGRRVGDAADMSVLELVERTPSEAEGTGEKGKAGSAEKGKAKDSAKKGSGKKAQKAEKSE